MAHINKQSEIDILRRLQKSGIGGFPLSNFFISHPLTPTKLMQSLEMLTEAGLVKVTGRKDLAALKPYIEELGPLPEVIADGEGRWVTHNQELFRLAHKESTDFFQTYISLTLRGHMAAALLKAPKPARKEHAPAPGNKLVP